MIDDIQTRESKRVLKELIQEIIYELEHPVPTLPTGLPRLDDMLDGGLRGGEMFVVGARPGVGKSAFALQVALEVVRTGKRVCIWTLEMSRKAWIRRAIAALAVVSPKKLRRGGDVFAVEEINRMSPVMGELENLGIRFAMGKTDPHAFSLEADIQAGRGRCDLLIVDYIQLMDSPDGAFSRENEVAKLSRTIKQTALGLNVPIMTLAQLNRDAENKIPNMSNLRESGSLESDADEVLLLHRDRDEDTLKYREHGLAILAKNRDGDTGAFPVRFNWRQFRFDQSANLSITDSA